MYAQSIDTGPRIWGSLWPLIMAPPRPIHGPLVKNTCYRVLGWAVHIFVLLQLFTLDGRLTWMVTTKKEAPKTILVSTKKETKKHKFQSKLDLLNKPISNTVLTQKNWGVLSSGWLPSPPPRIPWVLVWMRRSFGGTLKSELSAQHRKKVKGASGRGLWKAEEERAGTQSPLMSKPFPGKRKGTSFVFFLLSFLSPQNSSTESKQSTLILWNGTFQLASYALYRNLLPVKMI